MTNNEDMVLIPVPREQVELLLEISESAATGDRTRLESQIRDIRTATNTRKMLNAMEDGTFVEKSYMQKEEVNTAYQHALDTEHPTVESCFNEVMVVHGVTPEYIEDSKSNPQRDIKVVVQENKEHPKVKRMQRNKVLDIETLQKSSTPNQLITSITTRRSVSDRLDALESKVESLELRASVTEARQDGVDEILIELNPNNVLSKSSMATRLRDKGVKIKDIATELSVSERTVKRWLADYISLSPL